MFYVILNTRQRNFTYSRMRYVAPIYMFARLLVVGLRYTAVLSFACCWLAYTTCTAIIKFLLNSSIIFCRTLVGALPLANCVQHSASIYIPPPLIGERERANLVVQLARLLFVCMSPYSLRPPCQRRGPLLGPPWLMAVP